MGAEVAGSGIAIGFVTIWTPRYVNLPVWVVSTEFVVSMLRIQSCSNGGEHGIVMTYPLAVVLTWT
jgi:hypothetical protein